MFPKQEAKKEFGNPEILPYPIFTMYLTLSYKTQGFAIAYLATLNLAVLFIMIILGFLICAYKNFLHVAKYLKLYSVANLEIK